MIASVFTVILLGGSFAMLTRETKNLSSMARITSTRTRAQELIHRLEQELAHARGYPPTAWLTTDLPAPVTGFVAVDDGRAFPDRSMLLINRGTAFAERIRYSSLRTFHSGFLRLARGQQCTVPARHLNGDEVLWAGMAQPITVQIAPPASFYDGICNERSGPVFFRGDGFGFVFRVPTDPLGGRNLISGGRVTWGAVVAGTHNVNGWSAALFEPVDLVDEAVLGSDLNSDGDQIDTFDRGSIRLRSWDATVPNSAFTDVGLCPPILLQETCNWGGDLDGDGFDDPIFFFDDSTGRLHLRFSVLLMGPQGRPVVDRIETVLFLRNTDLS